MRVIGDWAYRGPYEHEPEEVILSRLSAHQGIIAVDTETVNTMDLTCIGVGVYINDDEGFYFRIFPRLADPAPIVLGMVANPEITKIYHNGASFDLPVLDQLADWEGYETPDDTNVEDSEYAARVLGLPGGLQRLGEEKLGFTDLFSIKDLFTEYHTNQMLDVPWTRVAEKCLNDCRTTWRLHHFLNRRFTPAQRDCYEVDRRLIHVLRSVETRGLRLRERVLKEHEERLEREVLRIERYCESEAGFKPSAPVQVGYVLAARGNILPFTKKSKQLRTDEETLERIALDDPLAQKVLDWRHHYKLLSTYVRPWLDKERAYTHFTIDSSTGRLKSGAINKWDTKNRNLQNIPGPLDSNGNPQSNMREVFGPDNGIFTWADHGQIELRCLAYISKDKAMMAEYAKEFEGIKPDLHSTTMEVAKQYVPGFTRESGKRFNFARVFGAGDWKLSKSTGVPVQQVPLVRQAMASIYVESEAWIRNQTFNHNGEYVESPDGRRYRLPEFDPEINTNPKAFAAHVSKCAVNYPCQGFAAGIVKRGLIQIFNTGVDLRLQVHDEYVVDGKWEPEPSLAWINPELHTPFETKSGVTWT